jgi:hypothetical protein
MTAVAAFLVLALAASPSAPARRTGVDMSNAARAKVGLLPRKPARTRADVRGRRLLTIKTPAPTYLAEPAPVAEEAEEGDVEPLAAADGGPAADAVAADAPQRVPARGPVEVVRLPPSYAPAAEIEELPVAAIAPPEEIDAIRFAAVGIETEVTLRLRFDP